MPYHCQFYFTSANHLTTPKTLYSLCQTTWKQHNLQILNASLHTQPITQDSIFNKIFRYGYMDILNKIWLSRKSLFKRDFKFGDKDLRSFLFLSSTKRIHYTSLVRKSLVFFPIPSKVLRVKFKALVSNLICFVMLWFLLFIYIFFLLKKRANCLLTLRLLNFEIWSERRANLLGTLPSIDSNRWLHF